LDYGYLTLRVRIGIVLDTYVVIELAVLIVVVQDLLMLVTSVGVPAWDQRSMESLDFGVGQ
jgi:hypothetical protein